MARHTELLEEWRPKLRNGIRFTVVHQSEDFQRTLIYLKNTGVFLGKVHVMLPITDVMQPMGDITQPITIEREHDIPMLGKSLSL